MLQRYRVFELLFAGAIVASIANAAPKPNVARKPVPVAVEAIVHFPGDARTAAIVYARAVDSEALETARVEAGAPRAVLKLLPGRYWLFAEPDDPGAPDIFGAYTDWSRCQAAARADGPAKCEAHNLAELVVEHAPVSAVSIDDWYLPADIVRLLDESLHRNPDRPEDLDLGAPRFSEYPARVHAPDAPFRFDPASHPEGGKWGGAVQPAATRGVNFAGHWVVVGSSCGESCTSYALIEWSSGRIFVPDALRAVAGHLPCERGPVVQHRADSRLLTVVQADDHSVVTRYYVWDDTQGSLTELASYRSSAQRYCDRN
jgi:hypothetical protein